MPGVVREVTHGVAGVVRCPSRALGKVARAVLDAMSEVRYPVAGSVHGPADGALTFAQNTTRAIEDAGVTLGMGVGPVNLTVRAVEGRALEIAQAA
jgi:hypothetical protein